MVGVGVGQFRGMLGGCDINVLHELGGLVPWCCHYL